MRELALGLPHRELVRHRIDLEQHRADFDLLAFRDRDAADLAGDVRRDQNFLRADIGIVGRDVAAAHHVDGERDNRGERGE